MSERLNTNITRVLLKAAKEEKVLTSLWTPVENEVVALAESAAATAPAHADHAGRGFFFSLGQKNA